MLINFSIGNLFIQIPLNYFHDSVELIIIYIAIIVGVNHKENLLDELVWRSLCSVKKFFDKFVELCERDVATTVGISVLEDEGGPLLGATEKIEKLILGDAMIEVGVNDIVEGIQHGARNGVALETRGMFYLFLGDHVVTVGVDEKEEPIDLTSGLVVISIIVWAEYGPKLNVCSWKNCKEHERDQKYK